MWSERLHLESLASNGFVALCASGSCEDLISPDLGGRPRASESAEEMPLGGGLSRCLVQGPCACLHLSSFAVSSSISCPYTAPPAPLEAPPLAFDLLMNCGFFTSVLLRHTLTNRSPPLTQQPQLWPLFCVLRPTVPAACWVLFLKSNLIPSTFVPLPGYPFSLPASSSTTCSPGWRKPSSSRAPVPPNPPNANEVPTSPLVQTSSSAHLLRSNFGYFLLPLP